MVESWDNIISNKEDISRDRIKEIGGIYNDRVGEKNSNTYETSRNSTGSLYSNNEQSQNNRASRENVEIFERKSHSNEQTSLNRNQKNNREQIENSNESSFSMDNTRYSLDVMSEVDKLR